MIADKSEKIQFQVDILNEKNAPFQHFNEVLTSHGFPVLKPGKIEILQVNVGKMCNQTCSHCHVDAGPTRKEIMTQDVMAHCLKVIAENDIATVDITGGAPEMNPHFQWFVEQISTLDKKIIVRSNLTILVSNKKYNDYPQFFKQHNVTVISSLPCYTQGNTDAQRGDGVFQKSIKALKMLNEAGYGKEGSGLELHLVYNPLGPVLPGSQEKLKLDYKRELKQNFNIEFNNLYTITNLPVNRFMDYLLQAGLYEEYMEKLIDAFNPAAVDGLMCKNTISVGWDGNLYNCDFNQMLELPAGGTLTHIKDFKSATIRNSYIEVSRHCFGCTAGAGSSCQGAIV